MYEHPKYDGESYTVHGPMQSRNPPSEIGPPSPPSEIGHDAISSVRKLLRVQ